jgi:hypothetical protein
MQNTEPHFVTMLINGLSASDHVRGVMTNCLQILYALRALCSHGMCDLAQQTIFRSVVVACSAWWSFTNATDRQRVNAFLRRSIRCGYTVLQTCLRSNSYARQQTNSFPQRS